MIKLNRPSFWQVEHSGFMLQSQWLSAGSWMTPWLPKANDVQLGIGTSWALPYEDSTKDLASSYYCPICQASAERWSRWEYLIRPAGGNSVTKFLPNGTNTKTTREIWRNTLHTPFDTSSCETFSIFLHKWNKKILTTVVRSIHMSMISIKINSSVNLQIGLGDSVSHGPHLQPPPHVFVVWIRVSASFRPSHSPSQATISCPSGSDNARHDVPWPKPNLQTAGANNDWPPSLPPGHGRALLAKLGPIGVVCANLLTVWASQPLRCMPSSVTTTWLCLTLKLGWHYRRHQSMVPHGRFSPETPEASRVPQRIGPRCWHPSAPAKNGDSKGIFGSVHCVCPHGFPWYFHGVTCIARTLDGCKKNVELAMPLQRSKDKNWRENPPIFWKGVGVVQLFFNARNPSRSNTGTFA